MKKVNWTVGAARAQGALHFLMVPLPFLAVWNGVQWWVAILNPIPLLLGLVPSLLVAVVAWGLWNRHAWARLLAMVFHGVTAASAFSVTVLCIAAIVLHAISEGKKTASPPQGHNFVPIALFWYVGGIAFTVFILSGGLYWWLRRARDPERR
jgi:hypothetical protein